MPTQKGIGVVWGISTSDMSVGAGTGLLRHTGQSYSRDTELVEHRDTQGEFVGVTSFAGTRTLELDVYPAFSTLAGANAAQVNIPAPGTSVTLTDATDSDINGDWLVTASGKRKSNTEKVVVTLSLKRWNTIAGYTTISA